MRSGDPSGAGERAGEGAAAVEKDVVRLLLAAARGLVVIDPDDAEQVERLSRFHTQSFDALRRVQPAEQVGVKHVDMMAWALRRYADPRAEWRPEEPEDVGAVVEDAGGNIYVRHVVIANATPWRLTDDDWRSWDQITQVVAVHSWGAPGLSQTFGDLTSRPEQQRP